MEQIEFIRQTDNRHLQTHIRFKIRGAFQEREEQVDRRRQSLQMMLAIEELQQEEELANLFRTRILENMQKRLDWIATAKFERSEAEREFLKLKQIQRELVNCEEMRPRESKKITEETKRIQLVQIAEKRGLQMKEKEIDKIWFEASMCLEKEKEKQQQYEEHLKRIIAYKTVGVLNTQLEHLKCVKELENEEKRAENIQNEREKNEDEMKMDFEERQRLRKKVKEGARQKNELQSARAAKLLAEKQLQFSEAKIHEAQNIQLQQEEEILKMNKILERESYDRYLQYTKDKKSEMNCKNKMLETALISHNRRMISDPISKIPYQKSCR